MRVSDSFFLFFPFSLSVVLCCLLTGGVCPIVHLPTAPHIAATAPPACLCAVGRASGMAKGERRCALLDLVAALGSVGALLGQRQTDDDYACIAVIRTVGTEPHRIGEAIAEDTALAWGEIGEQANVGGVVTAETAHRLVGQLAGFLANHADSRQDHQPRRRVVGGCYVRGDLYRGNCRNV